MWSKSGGVQRKLNSLSSQPLKSMTDHFRHRAKYWLIFLDKYLESLHSLDLKCPYQMEC